MCGPAWLPEPNTGVAACRSADRPGGASLLGAQIHALARRLWPINRSITGDGVRETLALLKSLHLPDLQIHEVPTGTRVLDWTVPREWKVREAYLVTPAGERICDFSRNNLHLVGYSVPMHCRLSLAELQPHLYSLPEQPDAIPYITSYYAERWGFCLSHAQRAALVDGEYEVRIDAELFDGSLTYGELLIPGDSPQEVFLSTYICHPSMANNELSGPTVTTFLAVWLASLPSRRYSYRIVFVPETIGSIAYLSAHLPALQRQVVAGFNISCVGDDRAYSFLPSRNGATLSDAVARHVLKWTDPGYKAYGWRDRGSDERQYCAPGVDLPIASIMRSKYAAYPEYHTSLDNLEDVVTPAGLGGGYQVLQRAIEAIEHHCHPRATVLGEPQLDRRGLYPTLSTRESGEEVRLMMDLLTWSDGTRSLLEIADFCQAPVWALYPLLSQLRTHQLLADTPA
jgi:aminopeptidase-like protein